MEVLNQNPDTKARGQLFIGYIDDELERLTGYIDMILPTIVANAINKLPEEEKNPVLMRILKGITVLNADVLAKDERINTMFSNRFGSDLSGGYFLEKAINGFKEE